jgi:MFS family permease
MSETIVASPPVTTESRPPGSRARAILLVLALSTFAVTAMQSMVMPVLSGLAASLHVSMAEVSWVLTASQLSAAVFTPLLGSLGDALGRRRVLVATLVLTTIGSVLVAVSSSMAVVLVGRVLQGLGFAAMPLAIGIVRSLFPEHRVPSSLSLLSAITGIGAGAGLVIAGLLVKAGVTGQAMFWVSAAATALGAVGTFVLIRLPEVRRPFTPDIAGLLTLSGGLVSLLLAVNRGSSWGWGSPTILGLFALGAVLLVAWVFVERRVAHPLVDIAMMRDPVVLGTNVTAFLTGAGMFGAFVLVVQYVQTPSALGYGFGMDALGAGLTLLPMTAGTLLASFGVAVMIRRVGPKWPLVLGVVVATATFAFLLVWHTHLAQFLVATGLLGLGLGLAMGAMPTLLNSAVAAESTSIANSVNQTLRSVGGSVGTTLATAILATTTIAGTSAPTVSAYLVAFAVSGVIGVVGIVAAVAVPYRHQRTTTDDGPALAGGARR